LRRIDGHADGDADAQRRQQQDHGGQNDRQTAEVLEFDESDLGVDVGSGVAEAQLQDQNGEQEAGEQAAEQQGAVGGRRANQSHEVPPFVTVNDCHYM
jgi:hypothetical protein